VNKSGAGAVLDVVLGIVGAVVGGWLFDTIGHVGVTGLNLYSILVAVRGAIIVFDSLPCIVLRSPPPVAGGPREKEIT